MLLYMPEQQIDLDALRTVVTALFPSGHPTLENVANSMGISPRTLQRRLANSGLTFTQVINEARFVTARQLIAKHYKLADIATMLGYTDAGSFTRAFERWTGMTPQKYRNQFAGGSRAVQSGSSK